MFIKDVCQACNLTKKAVEYYEKHGLIQPDVSDNGYRTYGDEDIDRLREISVLRCCGIGISDIRIILDSENRPAALARCRHLNAIKQQKMRAEQHLIDELIREYDIDRMFEGGMLEAGRTYTISEKLVMAFPGSYGVWLSLHFGRFLNIPIQTHMQQAAYRNIIDYLDSAATAMPEDLARYMEECFDPLSYGEMEELALAVQEGLRAAMADPEAYFEQNDPEAYLQYRLSDEFRQSPAGRMAEMTAQFHNDGGYRDVFIANMKTLSPAYGAYLTELETANARFVEKYPQAKRIYETTD